MSLNGPRGMELGSEAYGGSTPERFCLLKGTRKTVGCLSYTTVTSPLSPLFVIICFGKLKKE